MINDYFTNLQNNLQNNPQIGGASSIDASLKNSLTTFNKEILKTVNSLNMTNNVVSQTKKAMSDITAYDQKALKDKKRQDKEFMEFTKKRFNFEKASNIDYRKLEKQRSDIAKKEIELRKKAINEEKLNILHSVNYSRLTSKFKELEISLSKMKFTDADAKKSKSVLSKNINSDNNKLGFQIVQQMSSIYKGALKLDEVLSIVGSSVNDFMRDEINSSKERNISHSKFVEEIQDKIKNNLSTGLLTDIVNKKKQTMDEEIATMEKRMNLWNKEDVIKYNILKRDQDHIKTLEKLTEKSIKAFEIRKDVLATTGQNISEMLSNPFKNLVSSFPIIGQALGDTIGESLDKSLSPKIQKAISKLLFKGGDVAGGLDPVKVTAMLGSVTTAAVATAGLAAALAGVIGVGYLFYKVLTVVVDKAIELDSLARDVSKSFGSGFEQASKISKVIQRSNLELIQYGVTQESIVENSKALYDNLDLANVTQGNIKLLSKLTEAFGVSSDSGAKLITMFGRVFSYSEAKTERFFSDLQGQANSRGLNFASIVEDISGNMDEIVLAGTKNIKNLAKAAIEAKSMGNSFSSVIKLRDSFKDLPSAFEKAATLSFLTGKNVDGFSLFAKAQMGDLVGIQDIILNNMRAFENFEDFSLVPMAVKDLWAEATGQSMEELQKMFSYSKLTLSQLANIRKEEEKIKKDNDTWNNALSNISGIWDNIKNIFKSIYLNSITPMAAKISGFIGDLRSSMTGNVFNRFKKIAGDIGGYFLSAWESVQKIFKLGKNGGTNIWDGILESIQSISTTLDDFFNNKFDGIHTQFDVLLQGIRDTATAVWEIFSPSNEGNSVWTRISNALNTFMVKLADPLAIALRTAIFKTSPTLAQALGISGSDIARENAIMDYEKAKDVPEDKAKLFQESWDELNTVKEYQKQKWNMNPFEKTDPEKIAKFEKLQEKYNIGWGTDTFKAGKLTDILESKLRTLEDYERHYKQRNLEILGENNSNLVVKDQELQSIFENKLSSLKTTNGFTKGGFIIGPGSSKSDSIPAYLSNGEFVVNSDSTSKYRPVLESINGYAEGTPSTGASNIFSLMFGALKKGLGLSSSKPYLQNISAYFDSQLEAFKNKEINAIEDPAKDLTSSITKSLIESQKKITFHSGGITEGPSHANGGIPASVAKRKLVELEGGEGIINKRSMKNPSLRRLASMINVAGGGVDFAKGGFIDFANALAQRESDNNQYSVNKFGYMGLYQFGKDTLKTLGIKTTQKEFLEDKNLQNQALKKNIIYHIGPDDRYGFSKYFGSDMYGVKVTPSGIYGAAHLKGAGGAKKLLKGKDNADAFGTKASSYLQKFNDYDLSGVGIDHQQNWIWSPQKNNNSRKRKKSSGVIGMLPQFGDGGPLDEIKHYGEHLLAHGFVEKAIHKIASHGTTTVAKNVLPFIGNLLDPTPVAIGSEKTDQQKAQELLELTMYQRSQGINFIPKQEIAPGDKLGKYALGGSLIEPIASDDLSGIHRLFNFNRTNNSNVNEQILDKDVLNRVSGDTAEGTWNNVKSNIKSAWQKIGSKFSGAYVTDGMRYGPVKKGSGGRHQLGLAIDIGAPHARGATSKNPATRGILDDVANFVADKFALQRMGDWSGATQGHPKGQLIWRSNAGGNHFNHVHLSLNPEQELNSGGLIKAYDGMQAFVDKPTLMSIGNKNVMTGDNPSGKESITIQPKEKRDEEIKISQETLSVLTEIRDAIKSQRLVVNLDSKKISNKVFDNVISENY